MDLSIIIPCYNSGAYLEEAVNSIRQSKNIDRYSYGIIIIDDGSSDPSTLQLLAKIEKQDDCLVLYQNNAGPAAARNYGIKHASGRYLLFLDSDNKLRPQFIEKGISLLDSDAGDIIHGKPLFFGDSDNPRFVTGPFDIHKIILHNYIDTCCIMKHEVCSTINGFDENKAIIGLEDWDLHLQAYTARFKFLFLDEELYEYRIMPGSLSQQHSREYFLSTHGVLRT